MRKAISLQSRIWDAMIEMSLIRLNSLLRLYSCLIVSMRSSALLCKSCTFDLTLILFTLLLNKVLVSW